MQMLIHGSQKLNQMKLFFILFSMFYAMTSVSSAAEVKAYVNTQEVVKGNTLQLTIEVSGSSAAFPQIKSIDGFSVTDGGTSTSRSMSITSSGMKNETKTIKQYLLVPTKDVMIPAYTIRVGSEKFTTKPIKIKVVESYAPKMTISKDHSFVMKSSKKSVVVGESFVVTLYLSLWDRLGVQQVSEYLEPSSPAFFFKDLGKQKQYKQGNVSVLEKQYSVTAKKAGDFTIASASAKVGIRDRNRQDLFGRYGIRWISVVSNTLALKVTSPKVETDLVGEFTIESKIETQKVKVNKPVNLTIKIQGKGNLEDFVFPTYEIDGVTIYDDDSKVESHIKGGELFSVYSKNFVFISAESFTIPKRTISIYNTKINDREVLAVPRYEVEIEEKKLLNRILPTFTSKPMPSIEKTDSVKKVEVKELPWWMLVVSFLGGLVVMYLTRFIKPLFKTKRPSYAESEALGLLYAHIGEGKEVEEMVHKLYAKKNGDKSIKIDKKLLKLLVDRFR